MSDTIKQGTVTVVFTDLEGSTDLRQRAGDDAAQEVVRLHENITREEIAKAGGESAKALGDGFMVSFGSARQAINYAVSLQRRIDEHNREDPSKAFRVRIGINTGEVTTEREDLYGSAVNAASRICGKAQGSQILIPQVVNELAGFLPDLRIVDRGLFWLKGFPNRWRLFEVMWREKGAPRDEPGSAPRKPKTISDLPDLPRAQGPVVGRTTELAAIDDELERTQTGCLRTLALVGEAGIGKTRLLESAGESAREKGFGVLRIAADEELRGPFFLSRTLFALPAIDAIAEEAVALEPLQRARDAISQRDPTSGLSPQEQMLRIFDECTSAIRSLATEQPLAILIDDIQWADEDSLKMIRYLVRTLLSAPIFLGMTLRARTEAATGADNLLADLERMHICRRIRLGRFSKLESAKLLESLLGGSVGPAASQSLHSRAEGVPFFIEEFARAYRETGALQEVGGTWTLAQVTGPEVPASVQTLIERRLSQLEPETRTLLADAAILGRRFRLSDLSTISSRMGGLSDGGNAQVWRLAEALEPAADLGIISEEADPSEHDYTFTHDQIRAALASSISRQRRRMVHGAFTELLAADNSSNSLSTLAHHALQAGDEKLGVECSIKAARASLEAFAPEESVRICDAARAAASAPEIRADLLRIKDDALAVLERGEDRAANLAELAALASAIGDPAFEMEVRLRRASTARMNGELEVAIELAEEVRKAAESMGDSKTELEACLEIGQALMHSPLGESFTSLKEVDLDRATETFTRAVELAREIDDRSRLAASLRELAVIELGRVRALAFEMTQVPGVVLIQNIMFNPEVQAHIAVSKDLVTEALRIYEELQDQRGIMSGLITLAYTHITDFTRRGEAGRLEQIRRLRFGLDRMTIDSQKAAEEAQVLYSIHVYARSHLILDLALARGREAYEAARAIGDRWLEFLSAGGTAEAHLALRQFEEVQAWLDVAAKPALATPSPALSRRLETWRGLLAAAQGASEEMTTHLGRAVDLAREHGRAADFCQALAVLALESAKLGRETGDDGLLTRAVSAAEEALHVAATLPGVLPWVAQSWAAISLVSLVRDDQLAAQEAAREALAALEPRYFKALYIDVLWITAKALIQTGAPEAQDLIAETQENLFITDQSIADPEVKRQWIEVPMHKELAEIAGYQGFSADAQMELPAGIEEIEVEILRELSSGKTDAEIAKELDKPEEEVGDHLQVLFSKLGVATRNGATEFALRQGII